MARRAFRVLGIDVRVDPSWLFIAVLLTWNLTVAFMHWHPGWSVAIALVTALAAAILFFVSVLLHELAHSLVARRYGLPVHDITLFLFGGVSNIEREPPSPGAEFVMAVVGPLTSIVIGLALVLMASFGAMLSMQTAVDPSAALARLGPLQTLVAWLGPINILVGVFNLLPAFPLDGGRMLHAGIWAASRDLHTATRWASAIGQAFGWVLVVAGIAMAFGVSVPLLGRGLIGGLWIAFIGWFLANAATTTWRRQLAREMLEGLQVTSLTRPVGEVVGLDVPISGVVSRWLGGNDERALPVVDAVGRLAGLVALADVRRAPREAWETMRVGEIMTPADKLVTAAPNEDLARALDKLMGADIAQLPVLDGDRFVGMLHRRDLARWMELHVGPRARRYAH